MALPENNFTQWSDLRVRTASATALAAIAFLCIWAGGIIFIAFIMLAAILMMKEWEALTDNQSLSWHLSGYPYILIPCACLVWLRAIAIPSSATGFLLVIALAATISATDIGAYFTGRRFGKYKLAPAISPKKTWEGLGGGVLAAIITGLLFSTLIPLPHSFLSVTFVSASIALLAQIGDLFKSLVKRRAGVKDTGTLIPGHGGVLDRLDGYMFTTPLLTLFIFFVL